MIDREELLETLKNDLLAAGLDPERYLSDASLDIGFELIGVIEAVEIRKRSSGTTAKNYVEIYLRPVGWYKQLSSPIVYPVSTSKNSKWHHFIVALDNLGIPQQGRPNNLIGEVFTFQEQGFDNLKFPGSSPQAHLVRVPIKRWRSEAEAMAYLGKKT